MAVLYVEKAVMMIDKEEAIIRIIDAYDYYNFLQIVFDDDVMAEDIIKIAEVDDDADYPGCQEE